LSDPETYAPLLWIADEATETRREQEHPDRAARLKTLGALHRRLISDQFGNKRAKEGVHRCWCGSKYWEEDVCHSCGEEFDPRNYDENDELVAAGGGGD
jgi:hypothetical protein